MVLIRGKSLLSIAKEEMASTRRVKHEKDQKSREMREENSSKAEDIKRVVDRNISRMFADSVPAAVVDVVEVNGMNMRTKMIADRTQLLKSGRRRAEPSYFGEIKKQYLAALTGQQLVKAIEPDEDIPAGLAEGIAAARHTQRRYRKLGPLTHWLETRHAHMPQSGAVMVVDLLVETHVTKDPRQLHIITFVHAPPPQRFPNCIGWVVGGN